MQTKKAKQMEELLSRELMTLLRLARRYTSDADEAQDLVQDTMVLALRFSDKYEPGTNIKAWLNRVMRNRFISQARRSNLERRALESEGKHALVDWSISEMSRRNRSSCGGVVKDDGLSDPVQKAMNELSPEFKQVVWLCDVEGASYAEAAQTVDCPLGTVMSRLHRGRRALRKQLGSRERLSDLAAA